jgi:hypothetical protein
LSGRNTSLCAWPSVFTRTTSQVCGLKLLVYAAFSY